jgi:hypothetical protein
MNRLAEHSLPRRRRGVVLIIVLSLLAMFALMAVTFVLVSSQSLRSAKTMQRVDQVFDPPQQILHQAALQVIRGPGKAYTQSVIRAHSLLEGMYGNESYQGTISLVPTAICGGQLFEFPALDNPPKRTGCVLTMLSGQAAGLSTYIVGARYDTSRNIWCYQAVSFSNGASPSQNDSYLINGPAFSGMGFGYNSSTHNMDATFTTENSGALPIALLPNLPLVNSSINKNVVDSNGNPPGGANKDYDAVDYQTMILGAVFIDRNDGRAKPWVSGRYSPVIPSLHRPDLINYWLNKYGVSNQNFTTTTNVSFQEIRRLICLRPDSTDHPYFPLNKNDAAMGFFEPVYGDIAYGGYDVDNDGDGICDSIWVDGGFPVRSLPDGRLYKPMMAILCVDLNGRLNLNAHGSVAQTDSRYYTQSTQASAAAELPVAQPQFAGGKTSAPLPRGQGFGPADINLLPLFLTGSDTPSTFMTRLNLYKKLLCGDPIAWNIPPANKMQVVGGIEGRYGELTRGIEFSACGASAGPGWTAYPSYSSSTSFSSICDPILDPLSSNKFFEYWPANPLTVANKKWANYWGFAGLGPTATLANYRADAYGSPPDFNGSSAVGLDSSGHPMYLDLMCSIAGGMAFTPVNSPYEINLSLGTARGMSYSNLAYPDNQFPRGTGFDLGKNNQPLVSLIPPFFVPDNPFSASELEPILRPYDADSMGLNGRLLLMQLKYPEMPLISHRGEITTESWDVPVPSPTLTPKLRASFTNGRPKHIADLLSGLNVPPERWAIFLPYELLAGQKMNLNSPLGNGRDDNKNGVVDEPSPSNVDPDPNFYQFGADSLFLFKGYDYTNDPSNDPRTKLPSPAQVNSYFPTPFLDANDISSLPRPVVFNRFNGVDFGVTSAQQLQARYLYVLMMLLCDLNSLDSKFPGTPTQQREATCRLLAQWAVNAVDFRDRDSISTRFDYTVYQGYPPNLSTGWMPDGNHTVWGCERPELLISETLAFHDRKTEDLDTPAYKTTDTQQPDKDFDQKSRPQGSLFIKLYNPQGPLDQPAGEFYGGAPTQAYNWNDTTGSLMLGTSHGFQTGDVVDLRWQFWDGTKWVPGARTYMIATVSAYDPKQITVRDGPLTSGNNLPATNATDAKHKTVVTIKASYDNGGVSNCGIRLNRKTPAGSPVWRMIIVKPKANVDEQPDPDDPFTANRPDIERSVYFVPKPSDDNMSNYFPKDDAPIDDTTPNVRVERRYFTSNDNIAAVLPGRYAVVGSGDSSETTTATTKIGMRTQTPTSDTRQIVLAPTNDPTVQQVDVRNNKLSGNSDLPPATNIQPATAVIINKPRRLSVSEPLKGYPDSTTEEGITITYNANTKEYEPPFNHPLDSDTYRKDIDESDRKAIYANGTTTGFRMIHLQRLANPLANYDANTNPYLTVDSMPIDLTAFNGVVSGSDARREEKFGVQPGTFMFSSRERGEKEQQITLHGKNNIWRQEPLAKTVTALDANPDHPKVDYHYFDEPMKHSLGFLNSCFGAPISGNANGLNRGGPSAPFPWLTWNNRPYTSQLELLLVPILPSSKLLAVPKDNGHSYYDFVQKPASLNPYAPTVPDSVPYPHLLNFFESSGASAPNFHRILDYVYVPSKFAGTEIQANPDKAAVTSGHMFHPPFNNIPTFREPGRINLNTVFSEGVFYGLMNAFPGMDTADFWRKFQINRRGYPNFINTSFPGYYPIMNSGYPTLFARPFRTSAGASLVPPVSAMQQQNPPLKETDFTLLRADIESPAARPTPLFAYNNAGENQIDNTDRNPYFRYEGLQRLGNLVTTHSNQFAIWVTIGYFEVMHWDGGVDAYHPDGYTIGRELGTSTGEVKRHRAFYIYDRTIPVGFVRGEDLNVEKGILVKRYIE